MEQVRVVVPQCRAAKLTPLDIGAGTSETTQSA
jgi:hypothetical protein